MQDLAYLHVVTNHLPIMGGPIGVALLLLALWQRDAAIARAASLLFFGLSLATVAVYLLGRGGEDFVEHLPGVSHDAIDAHEDMATLALSVMAALWIVSVVALWRLGGLAALRRRPALIERFPAGVLCLLLLLGLAAAATTGYTGMLGGKIRHTEFSTPQSADGTEEADEDGNSGRRRRGRDHD